MIQFSYDECVPFDVLPEAEKWHAYDLNCKGGTSGLTKEEFKELVYLFKKGAEKIHPDFPYEIPQSYIDAWS